MNSFPRQQVLMSFAAVLLLNILSVRQSQGQEKIVAKQTSAPFTCETTTGKLHGTLEEPSDTGKIPLVLIIAGSGPTDRNGNNPMMTNNSLKMLGQGLVQKRYCRCTIRQTRHR